MTIPVEVQKRIEAMQTLRGWYVNAFAQIEFLLGAFLFEAYNHQDYADLAVPLPHGLNARIAKANEVIEREGAFRTYGFYLQHAIPRFQAHEETRNLLAHGFCQFVFTDAGDWAMRFTKWHRARDRPGETLRMMRDYTFDQFRHEYDNLQSLASEMVRNLSTFEQKYSTVD